MKSLHDRHTEAKNKWLSLQAGPRWREREAAYASMASASRAIEAAR